MLSLIRIENLKTLQIISFLMLFLIFLSLIPGHVGDTRNLLVVFFVLSFLLVKRPLDIGKDLKVWLSIVFFFYLILGILPYLFNSDNLITGFEAFYKRFNVILVIGFLIVILIRFKPTEKILFLSVLGATFGFIVTFFKDYSLAYDVMFTEGYRLGTASEINFPILAMFSNLLTTIFFAGFFWSIKNKNRVLIFAFGFSVVFSVFVGLMTGTRGAWIGLPEIIIGWLIYTYSMYFKNKTWKSKLILISVIVILTSLLISLVGNKVHNRLSLVVSDVEKYFDGDPQTSIGYRFVMYEGAFNEFKEHPVFGIGDEKMENVMFSRTQDIFQNKFGLNREGWGTSQAHNQYVQEALTKGLVGLTALLLTQLFLLLYFYKRISNNNLWAIAGFIFVIASFFNLMSYAWLELRVGMFFYFIIATILVYGASNPWLKTNSEESTGDSK